jgi:cell wall-associated NlpC family hydrolase
MISLILAVVLAISCLAITVFADNAIKSGIAYVNASALNMRSAPSTGSSVVGMASRDEVVVVIGSSGDWYHVIYNLTEGYMHKNYVSVQTTQNAELGYGKVNGTNVNMRTGPGTNYSAVTQGNTGDKVYILGISGGWFKVIFGEKICYIRSDFVNLTEIPYENKESSNSPKFYRHGKSTGVAPSASALNGTPSGSTSNSTVSGVTGAQILAEAQKYLGTPYVSGGASPSGFDCSGFVYYVLKQAGLSPYRTPDNQFTQGTSVKKSDLQVGDVVFFSSNSGRSITHVGIYSGNGQFIHAPNSRSVVSYSDLTSGYWANHYYGARRVTN